MKTFRDLLIWQKSINFVIQIYELTEDFPDKEKYGINAQLRRAAVSIPSNIAEGFGRNSPREFKRFIKIAMGSLFEVQTQIEISLKLSYITDELYKEIYSVSREIERMMSSFIDSLGNKRKAK